MVFDGIRRLGHRIDICQSLRHDGARPLQPIDTCRFLGYTPAVVTLTTDLDLAAQRVKGCCVPLAAPLTDVEAGRVAATLKAMSDPTRVQMLHFLKAAEEPICVCDFTAAFDLGQPTVSHHLAKLRDAGFVRSFKQGVWAFYGLRQDMPTEARQALALVP